MTANEIQKVANTIKTKLNKVCNVSLKHYDDENGYRVEVKTDVEGESIEYINTLANKIIEKLIIGFEVGKPFIKTYRNKSYLYLIVKPDNNE